jgi:hypothetical protein
VIGFDLLIVLLGCYGGDRFRLKVLEVVHHHLRILAVKLHQGLRRLRLGSTACELLVGMAVLLFIGLGSDSDNVGHEEFCELWIIGKVESCLLVYMLDHHHVVGVGLVLWVPAHVKVPLLTINGKSFPNVGIFVFFLCRPL